MVWCFHWSTWLELLQQWHRLNDWLRLWKLTCLPKLPLWLAFCTGVLGYWSAATVEVLFPQCGVSVCTYSVWIVPYMYVVPTAAVNTVVVGRSFHSLDCVVVNHSSCLFSSATAEHQLCMILLTWLKMIFWSLCNSDDCTVVNKVCVCQLFY